MIDADGDEVGVGQAADEAVNVDLDVTSADLPIAVDVDLQNIAY